MWLQTFVFVTFKLVLLIIVLPLERNALACLCCIKLIAIVLGDVKAQDENKHLCDPELQQNLPS